jgi:hypothetical protein
VGLYRLLDRLFSHMSKAATISESRTSTQNTALASKANNAMRVYHDDDRRDLSPALPSPHGGRVSDPFLGQVARKTAKPPKETKMRTPAELNPDELATLRDLWHLYPSGVLVPDGDNNETLDALHHEGYVEPATIDQRTGYRMAPERAEGVADVVSRNAEQSDQN